MKLITPGPSFSDDGPGYGLLCGIEQWLLCYGLQVPGNTSSRGEGQSGSSEDLGERD